jgi:sulfur carrier protein ThiS
MNVIVKLFGTLPAGYPSYDPNKGILIDIKECASVKELLDHLDIHCNKRCFVAVNNKVAKPTDILSEHMAVNIFQMAYGG